MKILLLNDNPVVNKLVTLSAHKTSDELEIVESVDAIELDSYDLLVVDDTLYSQETIEALQEKITYSKSLYICSRDSEPVESFTSTLKKPFLPTDLVELFSVLGKEANSVDLSEDEPEEEMEELSLDLDDVIAEENESDDDDILDLGSLEDLDIEDELILDEEDDIVLDEEDILLDEDDLALDEELSLDEDDLALDDDMQENILDKDEVQEVQDLLEETNSDDFTLDEELEEELEEVLEQESEELNIDEALLEEEIAELEEDLEEDLAVADNFEEESEEEIEIADDFEEELEDDLDLESQIENAVEELSEEELDSEIDVDTLMDITANDLSDIDALTSNDLKLAIGEDVAEQEEIVEEDVNDAVDTNEEVDGVEALKNLLTALSDKNVAASMKGMKISINITLGDN